MSQASHTASKCITFYVQEQQGLPLLVMQCVVCIVLIVMVQSHSSSQNHPSRAPLTTKVGLLLVIDTCNLNNGHSNSHSFRTQVSSRPTSHVRRVCAMTHRKPGSARV